MASEPAWMEGVHERDAMFGLPPTEYKDTISWAGVCMGCVNGDSVYFVPGFLSHAVEVYAERDGWQRKGNRMICPKCAAKASQDASVRSPQPNLTRQKE